MSNNKTTPDPVESFFARERGETRALDAGDDQWEGIVGRSHRDRRRRTSGRAAWAAAAAVLVAASVWGLTGRLGPVTPADTTPPATTPTTSSTSRPSPQSGTRPPSTAPSGGPSTVGGSGVAPVPGSFRVLSVSTGDARTLYALGNARCDGGQSCPVVAMSGDNGATWGLVHSFAGTTAATGSTGVPGPQALSQVRFASPSVGWVFGGAALRTSDGGATWHPYPHGAGTVLDLETDGKDVVLTTAGACSQGTCRGAVHVVRAPISATAATDIAGTIDGGTSLIGAPLSWHSGHAYVSVTTSADGRTPAEPMVLLTDGLHPSGPQSCGATPSPAQIVAPASGTSLFAICANSGAAGHRGYEVQARGDAAAAWHPVSTDALVLVNAGEAAFAASDASSLLAVSGGSPDLHGSMAVSADGGATWHTPKAPPATPDRGWAWVGAPGGPTFYAISADPSPSYWKSTDRGESWAQVTVPRG